MEVNMGKICPTCSNTSVWKYCEACERYFCKNCVGKETHKPWFTSNICPFCGKHDTIKDKEPKN